MSYLLKYREQNPEYNDLNDNDLITALHGKYNADTGANVEITDFQSAVGYQPIEQQPEPADQLTQPDQQMNSVEPTNVEPTMLELIGSKIANWGAGAGERVGDLGGALLRAVEITGRGINEELPAGLTVPENLQLGVDTDISAALLKGAEVLEGIDLGYQQKIGWEDVKNSFTEGGALSGSAYADVVEYGLEQGVRSIPDMVAVIYALPVYMLARSGEMAGKIAENKGKGRADIEDLLQAAPFAVASSLLERVGARGMTSDVQADLGKKMLKAGLKEAAKRSAKSGGKALSKEAATEAIQEGVLEYVGERYSTDVALDYREALDRAAAGAVAGGVFGGAVGTAVSVANEINFTPTKGISKNTQLEIQEETNTPIDGSDQHPVSDQVISESQVVPEVVPKRGAAEPVPDQPTVQADSTVQPVTPLGEPQEVATKELVKGSETIAGYTSSIAPEGESRLTNQRLDERILTNADIQPGHRVLEPASNGDSVVGNEFLSHKGKYDRIVLTPPVESEIDHVRHAYDLLRPGGKVVAVMGSGVRGSGEKAVEFREWMDGMGSFMEDVPAAGSSTGGSVRVTLDKNDDQTLKYKNQDSTETRPAKSGERIYNAPGHSFIGKFSSLGIPERREFIMVEGRRVKIPEKPQRIEPIMHILTKVIGKRIYFGKIKGKSRSGFYRPDVGEIRTRRKNDVEVLAHEMAHYLDMYSNVSLPNFRKLYEDVLYVDEVRSLSYTDATQELQSIEGFAEFVRLWMTNAEEVKSRAPKFYDAFNKALASDRKLLIRMREMQVLMHKFFFQGPDKLGQALIGKNKSFIQTFSEWRYRRDSRIRQQTIDRFHAARKIEQELTGKISSAHKSAWKLFRIANGGAEGIADYVMNYGTVNFDTSGDINRTGASLHAVLQPVKTIDKKPEHKGDKKIDLLIRYFVGRRALELHRQARENLIPKETAKEWAKLGGTYPVFASIHKEYQLFNQRLMDFYVDSGLITQDSREAMETMNQDYVPFHRIRESLTDSKGAGSAGFKRLKGGTANLNDVLVNIQDGISTNIRAALNNHAKQRLYQYISGHVDGAIFATHISPDSRKVRVYLGEMKQKITEVLEDSGIEVKGEIDVTDPGLLDFWQHGIKPRLNESGNIVDTVIINGEKKYYEVQDPLLQEMLLGMNPESYSTLMNVMFGAKNYFTRMITLGMEFMGANLVRDTIGATFISKNHFRPFLDSFKGMYSFITKDEHYQDFMRSGGGYSSRLHATTKEGSARRKIAVDEFGVMTSADRILSAIDNIGSAFEYGTRIGEFRLAKKNKRSDLDAGFAGSEISTDFRVSGANHFLTGYIRTIPFLNAMIQSQDRVFREAIISKKYDGNPVGMAMKAFLGLTIPTLLLYLINKDDEYYQAIPDYEKRTNWHIPVGDGSFVKIPRPYDVGFVFATMPELFFKYIEDEKGKDFSDGLLWTLAHMYGIDGTPALTIGWWDLVRNEKWTGAPVVPQSLSNIEATEQYTSNTSETFIRLGEATGMSPVKAEHVFKAYTGYLGGYLLWGTDHILWDESKFGEKPDSKVSDNVFLRRFLSPEVRHSSAAMEKFFDLKEKSDKIVATFKQTIDVRRAIKGKVKDAGKFKDDTFFGLSAEEKGVLFALNDSMNQLISLIYGKDGIKTAELKIKHDPKLTGTEKRKQLDQLWRHRNKIFMKYYSQADKALQKAKLESKNQEK